MVVQNRPGAFEQGRCTLVAQVIPAYTVTKLGVPLIWIYPFYDLSILRPRQSRQSLNSKEVRDRTRHRTVRRPT